MSKFKSTHDWQNLGTMNGDLANQSRRNVNNQTTNLVALEGQFINRRTQRPVDAGTLYHIHPDKGPMEGGEHDSSIKGGTGGHDFFDEVSRPNRNSHRGMDTPTTNNGTMRVTGNFMEIINQVYNSQRQGNRSSNIQSKASIQSQLDPYFRALWNDALETGGAGGDDVYGHFFCTGCGGTNDPGMCAGSGCLSCNASSMNYEFQTGNVNTNLNYNFNGSISCNISISF